MSAPAHRVSPRPGRRPPATVLDGDQQQDHLALVATRLLMALALRELGWNAVPIPAAGSSIGNRPNAQCRHDRTAQYTSLFVLQSPPEGVFRFEAKERIPLVPTHRRFCHFNCGLLTIQKLTALVLEAA